MDPKSMGAALVTGLGNMMPQLMKWGGYLVISGTLMFALIVVYYVLQFNIKVDVFPLYGSGKDGVFSVAKRKTNRARWIKGKTAWKPMWPLFNKQEIEPFDSEFIYPGNQVYVFDLNGRWIPGRVNINRTEEDIRGEINPVPYSVRKWESLKYKQNNIEYAEHDFWTDNKVLIIGLIFSVAMIIAACTMVWWTYQLAGGGRNDIQALTNVLKNINTIPGAPR